MPPPGQRTPLPLVQDKLKADALKRMSSQLLSMDDYRGLFDAHVAALAATARKQYLAALEEEVRPAIVDADGAVRPAGSHGEAARSWEAAAEVLATRPCFQRLPAQERQAMWSAFIRDTAAGACSGAPVSRLQLCRTMLMQGGVSLLWCFRAVLCYVLCYLLCTWQHPSMPRSSKQDPVLLRLRATAIR